MADNRLDPDINLLGYWGFDEALETDNALDGATNFAAANLVVTSALGVQDGRVGAARDFNGTSSFAAVTIARLRLLSEATLMAWVQLDSYNSTGSLLRTILSCGGPTTGDNLLYSVSVDTAGRLVYKHNAAGGLVVVRTPGAIIKTGQFYFVVVRRSTSGPDLNIEFFVDNALIPVADVTVNAVPSALPVPVPLANASSIFSVARSQKESDSSFWDGLLDEVSVHDVARSYQPFLRGTYYRVAIRNSTSRLTAPNTVVAVSSADMGSGVRWWCYERDRDLYVVRESPFGVFGPDTRLVTTGSGASTDARNVELIYDAASDTLLVLFVAGNRIFKLTANQTDVPVATPMPFTADTGGIIKSLDNADGGAFANGGGQRQTTPEDIVYVTRTPVKISGTDSPDYNLGNGGGSQSFVITQNRSTPPSIDFMTRPSGFGLAIGPADGTQSGYRIYRLIGGGSTLLGTATYVFTGGFYFFLFTTPPVYGDAFYGEALKFGSPTGTFTNTVVYLNNEVVLENGTLKLGREGSVTDTANVGNGGGQRQTTVEDIVYVNRTPVKMVGADSPDYNLGNGGGHHRKITSSGSNRPGGNPIEVE